MRREAIVFDSVLVNNRKFDWKVALSRRIISDGGLEKHMEIINGELDDNYFVMNSMEQMSKISSGSCKNRNFGKGDIWTDSFPQKAMLTKMIDTPGASKEKKLKLHSLFPFKHSSAKSASKMFGVSKRYIISKTGK